MMVEIVKSPECCGSYLGQLFSRIASGQGEIYFRYFCADCRQGKKGKEVEIDFPDDQQIRGMTREMLDQFRATKLARSWRVVITDEIEPDMMPSQRGYAPRRSLVLGLKKSSVGQLRV